MHGWGLSSMMCTEEAWTGGRGILIRGIAVGHLMTCWQGKSKARLAHLERKSHMN